MTANVTCASFPGERIQAGQEENEEGKMIYFDDYMAYQNEGEMQTILENLVQEVYPTARVIWKISSSVFPREMSPGMSVKEIMESKESVFSAYIVVNQAVNEEEKYYRQDKIYSVAFNCFDSVVSLILAYNFFIKKQYGNIWRECNRTSKSLEMG